MIKTRVICTHCSSERGQNEILCRDCGSPFIIDVEALTGMVPIRHEFVTSSPS